MSDSRLEALLRFLEEEPNDIFTHYAIGMEYFGQREFKLSATKLEEVIALDPTYIAAYQQLANTYLQLDREDDALKILEKGVLAAAVAGDLHAEREMKDMLDDLEDSDN